ncbi:hypothetical protein LCI18_002783 [Fusarium solani-melongenae]|uniref:Uncharacterized protein n=1 Tax=Fusarium solani subsp. cucurbitae TaxID=2747967 RepID=A0ACD3YVF4_FUSSC|nr:hypothetical protein LCI18_002783 [Fusarium solani-melongenae]
MASHHAMPSCLYAVLYRGRPSSNSYATIPRDQMSTASPYPLFLFPPVGKKKAEEDTQDKKANIAMTEDSIFPDISLPGGISTKATEYKELAHKGDKWESPIFSIGSANKSTDIPPGPKIQRKASPVSDLTPNGECHGQGQD